MRVEPRRKILLQRWGAWLNVLLLVCLFLIVPAKAQQISGNAAISQGFQTTDTSLVSGALVSLENDDTGKVKVANTERVNRLIGVVGRDSLVELSGGTQEVQVVTSGVTFALVSDLAGDIKAGDKITASPIEGVGMKATSTTLIIGTAQEDFKSSKAESREITDNSGKKQTIHIGLTPVQVNITSYSAPEEITSLLPGFLQQLANSVAGRDVSPLRVLISSFLLLLASVSIVVLLYSSTHSSIISIGRNPLSAKAVSRSLVEVGVMVVGILLITLIAIYLILTT